MIFGWLIKVSFWFARRSERLAVESDDFGADRFPLIRRLNLGRLGKLQEIEYEIRDQEKVACRKFRKRIILPPIDMAAIVLREKRASCVLGDVVRLAGQRTRPSRVSLSRTYPRSSRPPPRRMPYPPVYS